MTSIILLLGTLRGSRAPREGLRRAKAACAHAILLGTVGGSRAPRAILFGTSGRSLVGVRVFVAVAARIILGVAGHLRGHLRYLGIPPLQHLGDLARLFLVRDVERRMLPVAA